MTNILNAAIVIGIIYLALEAGLAVAARFERRLLNPFRDGLSLPFEDGGHEE